VLSLLAHGGRGAGRDAELAVEIAFGLGANHLRLDAVLVERTLLTLERVEAALLAVRALEPSAMQQLVGAMFAMVARDGKIVVSEAELLRLICAALDCPLPPLVDETE